MKTLLQNALIIDGTGAKRFKGELLVDGSYIAALGTHLDCSPDQRIDAHGQVICPGFIDTHSHTDLKILSNPYPSPKLRQGITTEVYGQDGVSMAPLPEKYIEDWKKNLAGLDGSDNGIDWHYRNTDGYLSALEARQISINAAYLVPHGNIRLAVMGLTDRQPTAEELQAMKELLREELKAGAVGLSTGLIYIPCAYSKTQELIELCKTVAEFDGVFVVHQRSEADEIIDSMNEILKIARESGVRTHFSHFKACGKKSWGHIPQMLKLLDQAKQEGLRISFDQYPYVAGSTSLSVLLPPWVQVGGVDQMLARITDENTVRQIQKDIDAGGHGWDNFVDFAGWDRIFITFVESQKNKGLIGKNLMEIAALWQTDPLHATVRILIEENNAVSMVDFYGLEEHVQTFLTRPEQNVCTDGILSGTPHPRVYGTCARILEKYVRKENVLTLEEAVYKLSYKGARVIGLADRGRLKTGNFADLVLFDPNTIAETGTFSAPCSHPEGIKLVMVNGVTVFDQDGEHHVPAGMVIRKKA
ncbi:N-acyl-D-amino-acid deacylase family protein [Ethanoligenens sp.]|uniref:N-acyl-D-amino-acid deacylase family protein n=1 Tax=Ethanoligenens sp. TaxID=2099655 RepID=UPI0039EB5A85